ncbi:MAG: DUF2974 domain-containing protein [Clostridia bacterium]|nr:DUF2974 domain-containing protein [Clostridia bacterium]
MATILDYLYWRGDISFKASRLNELDGLVLTRFAYLPFEHVMIKDGETIGELTARLAKLPDKLLKLEEDRQLLKRLEKAPRFAKLPVTDFVKENNETEVQQFSAITVHLSDTEMYIAFCGTDSTLLGWKEDFYMSFMQDVAAQKEALEYTQAMCAKFPEKRFTLGGHSKGGNLAVYAAVNLPADLKERLDHVSNYDGPGFPQSYIAEHDFSSILERTATFIPQESVFGRIHEHAEGFSVVQSLEHSMNQHNVYNWLVKPKKLTALAEPDSSSDIMYTAIQNILKNTSPNQRKAYIDRIYAILTQSDFSSLKEFGQADLRQWWTLLKNVDAIPDADRKVTQEVNGAVIRSFAEAVVDTAGEKLTDTLPVQRFLDLSPAKALAELIEVEEANLLHHK